MAKPPTLVLTVRMSCYINFFKKIVELSIHPVHCSLLASVLTYLSSNTDLLEIKEHQPTKQPAKYNKKGGDWYYQEGVDIKESLQKRGKQFI